MLAVAVSVIFVWTGIPLKAANYVTVATIGNQVSASDKTQGMQKVVLLSMNLAPNFPLMSRFVINAMYYFVPIVIFVTKWAQDKNPSRFSLATI